MSKAIMFYGPPGSGKGTQAELLARRFGFIHFDTGRYLERTLYSSGWQDDPVLKKEREIFDSGKLNTPEWVLNIVRETADKFAKAGLGVVYSGSPRTMFEAFGDESHEGLLKFLDDIYGKENLAIVFLEIEDEKAIKRNSARLVCSVCGLPILADSKLDRCSFCYGKAKKRVFDNPEKMKIRIQQFKERTLPILEEAERQGYMIYRINGASAPYEVNTEVMSKLELA